ncbi:MAG TPA: hypothetical protein VIH76_05950 [Candidatus Acidoferrales bacterium]
MEAMEALLNLIWLLLALTGTMLWVVYWRRDFFARSRRKQILYSAVGLICVLVLMFYAISLTDDLYEIAALVEDAALVSARSSKVSSHHHRPVHTQALLSAVVSSAVCVPPLALQGNVLVQNVQIVRPTLRGSVELRGPPLQSL